MLIRVCDGCGEPAKPDYLLNIKGASYRIIAQKANGDDADLCPACIRHGIGKHDNKPRQCSCDCHD